MWKIGAIVGIGLTLLGSGFLLGRASVDGRGDGTGEELYQDSLGTVDDIRAESRILREKVGSLRGELGTLDGAIDRGRSGVADSVAISEEITRDSGSVGDLSRSLGQDIADIGAASSGLAGIFGVSPE